MNNHFKSAANKMLLDVAVRKIEREYAEEALRRGYDLSVYENYSGGLTIQINPQQENPDHTRHGFEAQTLNGAALFVKSYENNDEYRFKAETYRVQKCTVSSMYNDSEEVPVWLKASQEDWNLDEMSKKFRLAFNQITYYKPVLVPGLLGSIGQKMGLYPLKPTHFDFFAPDEPDNRV